jgi:hypothetical protein
VAIPASVTAGGCKRESWRLRATPCANPLRADGSGGAVLEVRASEGQLKKGSNATTTRIGDGPQQLSLTNKPEMLKIAGATPASSAFSLPPMVSMASTRGKRLASIVPRLRFACFADIPAKLGPHAEM